MIYCHQRGKEEELLCHCFFPFPVHGWRLGGGYETKNVNLPLCEKRKGKYVAGRNSERKCPDRLALTNSRSSLPRGRDDPFSIVGKSVFDLCKKGTLLM